LSALRPSFFAAVASRGRRHLFSECGSVGNKLITPTNDNAAMGGASCADSASAACSIFDDREAA
jgi:hypothetical protein